MRFYLFQNDSSRGDPLRTASLHLPYSIPSNHRRPILTVTWLSLPAGWTGIRSSIAWPLQVMEATPFSAPSGFSAVIWYTAPLQVRVTVASPVRREARGHQQAAELGPDFQDVPGGGKVNTSAGSGHKGVLGPAKGRVVGAHDKLAVGVGSLCRTSILSFCAAGHKAL